MTALALLALRNWKAFAIGAAILVLASAALVYRDSLISTGWDRALEAVKVQDGTAVEAARKVQRPVDACYDRGWVWSTITGTCTEEAKP